MRPYSTADGDDEVNAYMLDYIAKVLLTAFTQTLKFTCKSRYSTITVFLFPHSDSSGHFRHIEMFETSCWCRLSFIQTMVALKELNQDNWISFSWFLSSRTF